MRLLYQALGAAALLSARRAIDEEGDGQEARYLARHLSRQSTVTSGDYSLGRRKLMRRSASYTHFWMWMCAALSDQHSHLHMKGNLMVADINLTDNNIILADAAVENTGPRAGYAFRDRSRPNEQRWLWYSDQRKARLWADSRGGDVLTVNENGAVAIDGSDAGYFFYDRTENPPNPFGYIQWALYSVGQKARLWVGIPGGFGAPGRFEDLVTFTKDGDVSIKRNLSVGGTVTQASSIAVKDDVVELSGEDALEALDGLSPVTFSYKADDRHERHIGFIAEDVPDLLANLDRDQVSPMDVVAVLAKVVKEQQQTITQLIAEVDTIKQQHRAER